MDRLPAKRIYVTLPGLVSEIYIGRGPMAWKFNEKLMIEPPTRFMTVWPDGTEAGAWLEGRISEFPHVFWVIAEKF